MNDKGLQVHIVQLREVHPAICILEEPPVLQVSENGVVQNDDNGQRDLDFPILIGDEECGANECKKMHFKQTMRLINELSHINTDHAAGDKLIDVSVRKQFL